MCPVDGADATRARRLTVARSASIDMRVTMVRASKYAAAAALACAIAGCVAPGRLAAPQVPEVSSRAPVAPSPATIALEGAPRQGGTIFATVSPRGTRLTLDGEPVPVAADGRVLLGFDRDARPRALLVARAPDGSVATRALTVAPGAWRIERVDAPLTAGRTSAEFARLRPPELARIAAARAVDRDADGWRQRFVWPAEGRHSGRFGAQRVYQGVPGSYHTGADVAVPTGTPVRAPADGVVALAGGGFTLEGNLVILDHGMGLTSAFLHLSRIDVRAGERVRRGDPLGLSGATGRATGPHLHWGVTWRGRRLDPALLAGE